jgi:TPP-dependent pyruvate/acetoin dehydrogenase alpha subunit
MTPLEMLQGAVGAKDDPNSGGRQMPSHWGHRALNIPSQGSPTGTQCLQAVGAAEAGHDLRAVTDIPDGAARQHGDEVTYVSIGDGATSEGRVLGIAELGLHETACRCSTSWKTTATRSRCRWRRRRRAATCRSWSRASPA